MNNTKHTSFLLLFLFSFCIIPNFSQDFVHPGILHKEPDFARMREKVAKHEEPYYSTWLNLLKSSEAQLTWLPRATTVVERGSGTLDNIAVLYRDVAAAYQHALIYKISGDVAHGNKAVEILNAWSKNHITLGGNADRFLAGGLNGYQIANAAEMMRGYTGFDVERFKTYLLNVYAHPLVETFLFGYNGVAAHNGAYCTNYRTNWDACNMAAMSAIGIFLDDKSYVNRTIDYFKNNCGNGNIIRAVNYLHPGENGEPQLGQWEESGRDQGHTCGGMAEYGLFLEMNYNQGIDLFAYDDSRFRKGAEYVAKYNILTDSSGTMVGKYTVPYTSYTHQQGNPSSWTGWLTEPTVSSAGRGARSSYISQVLNHYKYRAKSTQPEIKYLEEALTGKFGGNWDGPHVSADGGHPDTYDQPGFGCLTYTIDPTNSVLPWMNMDIMPRSIALLPNYGRSILKNNTLTVVGTGTGISGNTDHFQFVFQKLVDNGEIVTQIDSITEENTSSQAGLMIRDSLEQISKTVFLNFSKENGISLLVRDKVNKNIEIVASNASFNTLPCHIRISRSGDRFTASVSKDKINWETIGAITLNIKRLVYAGVAVSSTDKNKTSTVFFGNTTLTQGNMLPIVKINTPLSKTSPYIAPANIYISGNAHDNDGNLVKTEIYVNDSLYFTTPLSSFSYKLNTSKIGTYKLLAKAYDNLGAIETSDTVTYSVETPTDKLPYYKFDETKTGYFAYDASGNNLVGLLYGAVPTTAGKINNAVVLDGVNDYIKLPSGLMDKVSNFTIATWIYLNEKSNWNRIIDFGSSTNSYMFLTSSNSSGLMSFEILSADGRKQTVTSTKDLPVLGWHHVSITLDPLNILKMYLDGENVGTGYNFQLRPYDIAPSSANYIGKSQFSTDPYLNGWLDEMRFYNYALSSEEINNLVSLTSVKHITLDNQLFHPNPAKLQIFLNNSGYTVIDIFDINGKKVLSKEINIPNTILDIKSLQKGVYLLKSTDKNSNIKQQTLIVNQ